MCLEPIHPGDDSYYGDHDEHDSDDCGGDDDVDGAVNDGVGDGDSNGGCYGVRDDDGDEKP